MTSSGTYNFNPTLGDIIPLAYSRIQIRRPEITAEHIQDAILESNFLLAEFSNLQPLLWKSELISQVLTQGVATYTLPSRVVMILVCYTETNSNGVITDRVLGPLSTTEYASIPNKTTQAQPTSFWLDRQKIPMITFWQTPDGGGPYTAKMQVVTQVQDAVLPNGVTLDLPYRFLDAYISGLSARLARIRKPEVLQAAQLEAKRTWDIAATQDVESVNMSIMPAISSYYPRG